MIPVHNVPEGCQKKLIELDNAKKIWGTLRSTTCSAVLNAINRTISESLTAILTLKRKYKSSADGTTKKWWFVQRAMLNYWRESGERYPCIQVGDWKVFTALRIMLQQPVFQLLPHCHPHCRLARLAAPLVILLQVCLMLSPIHHIHHNILLQVLLYSTLYVHHHPSNQESHKHQNLAMLDNHHHNHLQ